MTEKFVKATERELEYWNKREIGTTSPKDTNCFQPEPVYFHDEQDVMEMTTSACAVPARFVE